MAPNLRVRSARPRLLLLFSCGTEARRRVTRCSGTLVARPRGRGAPRGRWGTGQARLRPPRPVLRKRPPPGPSRGHPRGKQQSRRDAHRATGRGPHPARAWALAPRPAPRPGAPPTAPALPNRRRRRWWEGCWGGRTLNGRSRLRGDVTRRCTCRAPESC